MKQILICLLLLVAGQAAFAQKFSLKGKVVDEQGSPLPSATILLLQPKDSTLISFASTNAQGVFEIKNVNNNAYLLKISFVGFEPAYKIITAPTLGGTVEMGTLVLQPASTFLGEVLVKGEQDPVTIKKDTLEFNAGSFKTQPNAVVEELLKKLPGVQVESDGTVTVQGERVQRVLVDGKEFFGNDPKIATKNLPADAVNKIQVFDKKSDQAEFSGMDDGQRTKTINLELKEEKRNALFGNVMAGAGTDERFQSKLSLNKFRKGKQFSALGMANNVNNQGFGLDDYMAFTGASRQMASGGQMRIEVNSENGSGIPLDTGGRTNGLIDSYGGGINFNQQLSKNTEANGSYFLNYLNQDIRRTAERAEFFGSDTLSIYQNGNQVTTNTNQRLNLTVDHKIDSANSLKVTSSLSYNKTKAEGTSFSESFTSEGAFQNENTGRTASEGAIFNAHMNLLFRHKFAKKGRTVSLNTIMNLTGNNTDFRQNSLNRYAFKENEAIHQLRENKTATQSYTTTLSATEPLGNRRYLEANYSFRQNLTQFDQSVYDIVGQQPEVNVGLTNKYNSGYHYHRIGGNVRLVRDAFTANIGGNLQLSELSLHINEKPLVMPGATISRNYQNFLPNARFNYDFSNNRRLDFNYETSIQEPSVRQLQPVVDNSNPLTIYKGNPALRPSYNHQWRVNFTMFNPTTFVNFFAFVFMNYTTNAITNAVTYDQNFVRTTQPVNVKNSRNLSLNLNAGLPVRKYHSRVNVGVNLRQNSSMNLLNNESNLIDSRTVSGNVRYEFRIDQKFDFSLRSDLSLQTTEYSFENNADQQFVNQTYAAESNIYLPLGFHLHATYDVLVYNNPQFNFSQTIPLLHVSLAKQFLKNKSGELRLIATNLLNRDLGVNQTANANYVERETLNSLGQYFMLQLTYNLNKHLNPMGNRGGNGIRMMR